MSANNKRVTVITCFILYFAFLVPVLIMNCSLCSTEVLDETTNLSIAAFLSGYDWSYTNLAIGQYFYKYFQVLFYVPLFRMNIDPYLRYRLIMAFNSVVFCFIPLICFYILHVFIKITHKKSIACSVAVGTISSALFYTQHASSDLFVEFFPWITLLLLIKSMKAIESNEKKKAAVFSFLIALISVCSYASHTRGIILVISVFIIVVLMAAVWKKKVILSFIYYPSLVVFLIVDRFATQFFKANAFPFGVAHGNIASMDKDALISILTTRSGFIAFIKLCIGWAYTAATSTFGLCVCALLCACIILIRFHKNKEESDKNELLITYMGVLNFLGTAAMGIIYFYPHVKPIFLEQDFDHANRIIYERYMAYSFGFLCLIVFIMLIKHKDWFSIKLQALSVLIQSVTVFLFTVFVASYIDKSKMPLRHSVSLLRFLDLPRYGKTTDVYPDISFALLKMGIYSVLVFCLLLLLYNLRKKAVVLILVFALFNIENIVIGFTNIRYSRNNAIVRKSRPVYDAMTPLLDIDEKYKTICCCSKARINELQVIFPDFVCVDLKQRSVLPDENVIYIINTKYNDYQISYLFGSKDYYLVANLKCEGNQIFISGEGFASYLEKRGHTLVKYSK